MNQPILDSYSDAAAIVVQSSFNKELVERYFGVRENINIIHNGTNLEVISSIPPANIGGRSRENVWLCASSWRPHKRLNENIRYFLDNAPKSAVLLVAGSNSAFVKNDRIFDVGDLSWEQLISVMKASSHFIHLSWLDHCPNVVVDARASGCHIVCSSTGGTAEISGPDSTIIEEDCWDFVPTRLYDPPPIDFTRKATNPDLDISVDIRDASKKYVEVFNKVIKSSVGDTQWD